MHGYSAYWPCEHEEQREHTMSEVPTGWPWYCPHTALMYWLAEAALHDAEQGRQATFCVALQAAYW